MEGFGHEMVMRNIKTQVFIKHDPEYQFENVKVIECLKGIAKVKTTDGKTLNIEYGNLDGVKKASKYDMIEFSEWWKKKKSEIARVMKKDNHTNAPGDTVMQIYREACSYIDSRKKRDLDELFRVNASDFNTRNTQSYFDIAYEMIGL